MFALLELSLKSLKQKTTDSTSSVKTVLIGSDL